MEKTPQKYLYETFVNKEIEEKIVEKRQENGAEVEVSKTVKTLKPVKLAILKPNRKKFKEAEIFYAQSLSSYLKKGLLPHSLVSKRYLNDGGPLSENAKKVVTVMRENYTSLQVEYFGMKSPLTAEQTKRRGEILVEMTDINKALQEIENSYSEIFENTAEAKSRNDLIEWWILTLSLIEEEKDGKKNYVPFFPGEDTDARMAKLEELEALEDDFTNEVIKKFSYFISFWSRAGLDVKLEDFKSAEENYNLKVTDYKTEEASPEPAVETNTGDKVEVESPVV